MSDAQISSEMLLKVGNSTSVHGLGTTIYRAIFDDNQMPVLRAVGAGAVAQACKGIGRASTLVAGRGRTLAMTIGFDTIPGEHEGQDEISAQTFHLFLR